MLSITSKDWNASRGCYVLRLPQHRTYENCELAITSVSMYNSFKNISAALGNNTISFTFPGIFTKNPITGATFGSPLNSFNFSITVPDGYYDTAALNYYLQSQMFLYKLYVTNAANQNIYFMEFTVNLTAYATQVNLYLVKQTSPATYTIPTGAAWTWLSPTPITPTFAFSQPGFGLLVGLPTGSYGGSASSVSQLSLFCPVINPISSLILGCNLVDKGDNFIQTDALCSFGLVGGFGKQLNPVINPCYVNCKSSAINEITLTVYDQNYNVLRLFDYEANISVDIRKKRN